MEENLACLLLSFGGEIGQSRLSTKVGSGWGY